MTAATMTATNAPNPMRFLLFVLGVALLAAIALAPHAVKKHGSEAVAVRAACENGGEVARYKANENPKKFYLICDTGDGLGIQIIECTKRGPMERSSFIPKATQHQAGSWLRVVEYLSAKSTQVAVGALCG